MAGINKFREPIRNKRGFKTYLRPVPKPPRRSYAVDKPSAQAGQGGQIVARTASKYINDKKLTNLLQRTATDMAEGAAEKVKRYAKEYAPVRSGRLRQSIHIEREGANHFRVRARAINPEDGYPYAGIQEFGGGGTDGHIMLFVPRHGIVPVITSTTGPVPGEGYMGRAMKRLRYEDFISRRVG